ncbi:MAG: hypothetical protein ACYC0O_01375 [Desulfurivibrionaceae bacterium]|nr:hypothetical protein [Desulfurivibrionaceae bacterium]MDP2756795.1 hypothetical protein [Desulfurivibrionaceae bacterium]
MILSLDESIQKLKTEILSQDWSLSQKKIEPLQAAFTCLKNRFNTRKNALAILTMADSVLLYARKRQGRIPPEFIDFLKETMAHVVNMYEDTKFDPDRDAEVFKRVYGKFAKLKEKVAAEKSGEPAGLEPWEEPIFLEDAAPHPAQQKTAHNPAGKVPGKSAPKVAEPKPLPVQPGAMIRPITVGRLSLAIAEEHLALIKPLSPKKREKYIHNSQVPLKGLGGWFGRLSGQMKGSLALLKNSKLKKLILPLMVPRGMTLADIPDEEAAMLVVVSKGNWHGVILCRSIEPQATPLLSLARAKNGDIVGPARLGDDRELQLLDISRLLEREGFLFMPE